MFYFLIQGTDAPILTPMSSQKLLVSYQHKPLKDDRSIRILMLEPAPVYESPIRCSLVEVNLDIISEEDHGYTALSYAWGYKIGDREVICEDKPLLVTRNCEEALRTLRDKRVTKRFWVDAICIDQTTEPVKLQEKSHQVKMMGEIYKRAITVLVWFGTGDRSRAVIMEHLEKFVKYHDMQQNSNYLKRFYARSMQKRSNSRLLEYSKKGRHGDFNFPLQTTLQSPWMLRVWTVQEVAFAQSCSIVIGYQSGYYLLSWDTYIRIFNSFLLNPPSMKRDTKRLCAALMFKGRCRALVGEGKKAIKVEKVIEIMAVLPFMKATESRAMVYAIYPILENFGVSLPDPDYSKSVEMVYEDMTRSVVNWAKSLGHFHFVCTSVRKPNIPSWVPDWQEETWMTMNITEWKTVYGDSSPLTFPEDGKMTVYGKETGKVRIRAARDLSMAEWWPRDAYSLNVRSLANHATLLPVISIIRTLREWIAFSKSCTLNDKGGLHLSLLCQTLMPDSAITSEEQKVWEIVLSIIQYPENCEYDLDGAIQRAQIIEANDQENRAYWTKELREVLVAAVAVSTPNTSGPNGKPLPHAEAVKKLFDQLSSRCADRAFFITEDGRMGTSFHTVQAGDVLVRFKGTRQPMMLRKTSENYILVGPADVVGLDYPVDPLNDDISTMRQFTLI